MYFIQHKPLDIIVTYFFKIDEPLPSIIRKNSSYVIVPEKYEFNRSQFGVTKMMKYKNE